jgi:TolB-like protein/tRNA A-37 threonylcarbamoyl transferase component Bud32/Tfp pilus assembly protein PilF
MPDDPVVDRLASAVAAGEKIDWSSTKLSAPEAELRDLVRELAVIDAIAEVHRSAPLSDEGSDQPSTSVADAREWGPFRLLEPVGRGAWGEVYRAWDTRLDREVALKLLPAPLSSEDARATLIIEEGRLLARVRHPNVVTIYGAERIANQAGLWMELIRGRTLEEVLQHSGVFGASEAIEIGIEICRAVSAVHGAGLLHRDIKAHNVMRSEDGRIVLMDFGAGRELDDDAPAELAGTPLYLAPEVLKGQPSSVQSDLYSLGVLIYHLVTGTYPVTGRTVREIRGSHERGERKPLHAARPDVPPRLARVVERATDPSPERRYQTVAGFSQALAALRPRARFVRALGSVAAVSAACLIAGLVWEGAGRHAGSANTPSGVWRRLTEQSVVLATNTRPIVAVLPFRNLSADADTDWFVDGLVEEIVRDLATVNGMEVRSSAASFALKGQPRNLRDIGERLGVNLVVEGSVLRDGTRLRMTAQLMEIAGDAPLWFTQFDRELKDVFAIQDEVSRAIVTRLRLTLGSERRRQETQLDAYDAYLRGRSLVDRRGIANMQTAAGFFERAIARDPAFAPAHAGLANAYAFMSFPYRGIAFATAYPIMRPAAVQAVALDPRLAEAHVAMGWVRAYERDWANAEQSFQEAIRLNPSLIQAYTSYSVSTLQALRKFDEALRLLKAASAHDPLSLDLQREIGEVQLFSGRFAEAAETFRRVLQADPDFPFVHTYLATALVFAGRPEEALTMWQPGAIWPAAAYVRTGRRAEAERLLVEHAQFPFRVAAIAATLGHAERAADAVERVALHEPHRIGRLLIMPELSGLRDHPRVVAIRKRFGLP